MKKLLWMSGLLMALQAPVHASLVARHFVSDAEQNRLADLRCAVGALQAELPPPLRGPSLFQPELPRSSARPAQWLTDLHTHDALLVQADKWIERRLAHERVQDGSRTPDAQELLRLRRWVTLVRGAMAGLRAVTPQRAEGREQPVAFKVGDGAPVSVFKLFIADAAVRLRMLVDEQLDPVAKRPLPDDPRRPTSAPRFTLQLQSDEARLLEQANCAVGRSKSGAAAGHPPRTSAGWLPVHVDSDGEWLGAMRAYRGSMRDSLAWLHRWIRTPEGQRFRQHRHVGELHHLHGRLLFMVETLEDLDRLMSRRITPSIIATPQLQLRNVDDFCLLARELTQRFDQLAREHGPWPAGAGR